jgi:hypothetical protein
MGVTIGIASAIAVSAMVIGLYATLGRAGLEQKIRNLRKEERIEKK